MARSLKLLLTENVDGTGIVGDVVTVRKGFARNYLLPRNFATTPSEAKVKELAQKRADAQKMLAELRKQREVLVGKLEGFELTTIRSCNDLGILYGAVTQQDMCDELAKAGYPGIKQREVRLGSVIKRVGDYEVHVKFESDLEATVKLHVKPDRELDMRKATAEANAAEPAAAEGTAPATGDAQAGADGKKPKAKADGAPAADAAAKTDKPAGERRDGDRKERGDREERRPRNKFAEIPPPATEATGKGKWGKLPTDPSPQDAAADSKKKRR